MAAEPIPDLFARARAGDRDAWESIYHLYYSRIRSYLLRETGDEDVADDLTSDTFYKALRGIHATRDDTNLQAWLYRIARNLVIDRGRRSQIIRMEELDMSRHEPLLLDDHHPESASLSSEDTREVSQTLGRLPESYQKVLRLFYFENLSLPEIAVRLGQNLPCVKSRIHRAREAFRGAHHPLLLEHRLVGPLGLECANPNQRAAFLLYASGYTLKEIKRDLDRSERSVTTDIISVLRLMGMWFPGRAQRSAFRKQLPSVLAKMGIHVAVVARGGWALPGAPLLDFERRVVDLRRQRIRPGDIAREMGVARSTERRWNEQALAKLGPSFALNRDPLTRRQREFLTIWSSSDESVQVLAKRLNHGKGLVASLIVHGRKNLSRLTGRAFIEMTREVVRSWLATHPSESYSLRNALDGVTTKHRHVIRRRYDARRLAIIRDLMDGVSHRIVARRHGLSVGTCCYLKEAMCLDCGLPRTCWREAAAIILSRHGQGEETDRG